MLKFLESDGESTQRSSVTMKFPCKKCPQSLKNFFIYSYTPVILYVYFRNELSRDLLLGLGLVTVSKHTFQKVLFTVKHRNLPSSSKAFENQLKILYLVLESFNIISNPFHSKQFLGLRKLVLEWRWEYVYKVIKNWLSNSHAVKHFSISSTVLILRVESPPDFLSRKT